MIIEIMFVWKSLPKYDNYIECTNNMATVNGCDRILKADLCNFVSSIYKYTRALLRLERTMNLLCH